MPSRRLLLLAAFALPALCGTAGLWITASPAAAGAEPAAPPAAAAAAIAPLAGPGAIRVRLRMDVTGELFAPAGGDAATERRPVTVRALFDFDETTRPSDSPGSPDSPPGSILRSYVDAAAEIRVGEQAHRSVLAGDARRVLVSRVGTTPVPCLPAGILTDEERDLLETPFDPLLLDGILAGEQVAIGGTWQVPQDVAAGLLAIDTIESGGLTARLDRVDDGTATVRLSGIVDGAVDGVPTHVVVDGTLATPARGTDSAEQGQPAEVWELWGPVRRVAVVLQERRQASHVAPGLDVEARIVLTQSPVGTEDFRPEATDMATPAATDAGPRTAVGRPARRQGDGGEGGVWRRDGAGRFDLVRDVRWRVVEDGPGGLVLRYIDRGALVAQCSITALDPLPSPAEPPTVAELERDVRRSLAGQIGDTEEATAATRPDGHHVVRLSSTGMVGGRPFAWIHYAVTAPDGTRVNVGFTLEPAMRGRFAAADRLLVEGLRPGRPDRVARRGSDPAQ